MIFTSKLKLVSVFCFQGIFQKAQALYYQGDFEMSLVFYHRGHKLRPELQEFRLGIQKAQEAIDNSVGCKSTDVIFPRSKTPDAKPSGKPLKSKSLLSKKSSWSLEKVCSSLLSAVTANFGSANNTSKPPRPVRKRSGKKANKSKSKPKQGI